MSELQAELMHVASLVCDAQLEAACELATAAPTMLPAINYMKESLKQCG